MSYQDDDDDVIAAEEGELPERATEAKPFVPRGLLHGGEEDGGGEGDEGTWRWTLRKSAAYSLDTLCSAFNGEAAQVDGVFSGHAVLGF